MLAPEAVPDAELDLEFAYTPWRDSCRDPYTIAQACRRRRTHSGEHATGFGADRRRWPRDEDGG